MAGQPSDIKFKASFLAGRPSKPSGEATGISRFFAPGAAGAGRAAPGADAPCGEVGGAPPAPGADPVGDATGTRARTPKKEVQGSGDGVDGGAAHPPSEERTPTCASLRLGSGEGAGGAAPPAVAAGAPSSGPIATKTPPGPADVSRTPTTPTDAAWALAGADWADRTPVSPTLQAHAGETPSLALRATLGPCDPRVVWVSPADQVLVGATPEGARGAGGCAGGDPSSLRDALLRAAEAGPGRGGAVREELGRRGAPSARRVSPSGGSPEDSTSRAGHSGAARGATGHEKRPRGVGRARPASGVEKRPREVSRARDASAEGGSADRLTAALSAPNVRARGAANPIGYGDESGGEAGVRAVPALPQPSPLSSSAPVHRSSGSSRTSPTAGRRPVSGHAARRRRWCAEGTQRQALMEMLEAVRVMVTQTDGAEPVAAEDGVEGGEDGRGAPDGALGRGVSDWGGAGAGAAVAVCRSLSGLLAGLSGDAKENGGENDSGKGGPQDVAEAGSERGEGQTSAAAPLGKRGRGPVLASRAPVPGGPKAVRFEDRHTTSEPGGDHGARPPTTLHRNLDAQAPAPAPPFPSDGRITPDDPGAGVPAPFRTEMALGSTSAPAVSADDDLDDWDLDELEKLEAAAVATRATQAEGAAGERGGPRSDAGTSGGAVAGGVPSGGPGNGGASGGGAGDGHPGGSAGWADTAPGGSDGEADEEELMAAEEAALGARGLGQSVAEGEPPQPPSFSIDRSADPELHVVCGFLDAPPGSVQLSLRRLRDGRPRSALLLPPWTRATFSLGDQVRVIQHLHPDGEGERGGGRRDSEGEGPGEAASTPPREGVEGEEIKAERPAGTLAPLPPLRFDHERNHIILHPDTLVSGTRVASASGCVRAAVLGELVGGSGGRSGPKALLGTLTHELAQLAMVSGAFSAPALHRRVPEVVAGKAIDLLESGLDEREAEAALRRRVPDLARWMGRYLRPSPLQDLEPLSMGYEHRSGQPSRERLARISVSRLYDVEESVWLPRLGIKGVVDAAVELVVEEEGEAGGGAGWRAGAGGRPGGAGAAGLASAPTPVLRSVAPLEIKTGREHGSHQAQVSLYLLLLEARYGRPVPRGLLWYTGQVEPRIVRSSSVELAALLALRNEVAGHLVGGAPPPLAENRRECRFCFVRDTCALVWRIEGGAGADGWVGRGGDGGGGDAATRLTADPDAATLARSFDEATSLLEDEDAAFLRRWDRALTLEEREAATRRGGVWATGDALDARVAEGRTLAGLELAPIDGPKRLYSLREAMRGKEGGAGEGMGGPPPGPAERRRRHGFVPGELLLLSRERDVGGVCVARASFVGARGDELVVRLNRELRQGLLQPATLRRYPSTWRLDRDDPASAFTRQRGFLYDAFRAREEGVGVGRGEGSRDGCAATRVADRIPTPASSRDARRAVEGKPPSEVQGRGQDQDPTTSLDPFHATSNAQSQIRRLIVRMEAPRWGEREARGAAAVAERLQQTRGLSPQQAEAVGRAVEAPDYWLVQGAPGAGKTTAIVTLVEELVARGKRVLVSAYTNSAVDNVLLRLLEAGVDVLRTGRPDNAAPALRPHCLWDDEDEAGPGLEPAAGGAGAEGAPGRAEGPPGRPGDPAADPRGSGAPVPAPGHPAPGRPAPPAATSLPAGYGTTLQRSANNVSSRTTATSRELLVRLSSAAVVGATCLGCASLLLQDQSFDCLVLDEAGQVTVPAALGAMRRCPRWTLVGDWCQLPPLVSSSEARRAGLGESLLGILAARHPQALSRLVVQHRMCEDIAHLASMLFYDGALACASERQRTQSFDALGPEGSRGREGTPVGPGATLTLPRWIQAAMEPSRRVIFFHVPRWSKRGDGGVGHGPPARESVGRAEDPEPRPPAGARREGAFSVGAPAEARAAAELVRTFLTWGADPNQLAVISPHRAQVALLTDELRAGAGSEGGRAGRVAGAAEAVEVWTVDKAQGRDRDVVVLSLGGARRGRDSFSAGRDGDRPKSRDCARPAWGPPDAPTRPPGEWRGGALADWRRVNVALTRAKRKLVILGDLDELRQLDLFRRLLALLEEVGAVESVLV